MARSSSLLKGAVLLFAACLMGRAVAFVKVDGMKFVDENGCDLLLSGFNSWKAIEQQMGFPDVLPSDPSSIGPDGIVAFTLRETGAGSTKQEGAVGFNIMRLFAHADDDNGINLQTSPGKYDEKVFAALDKVIALAAENGVRVILSLADNWKKTDSIAQYVEWCAGSGSSNDVFWTNDKCRSLYKDHMEVMLNRVNTVSDIKYMDDPTIFAWNLLNEPRCIGCSNGEVNGWIKEMAEHYKSLNKNQLLTVGEEGFFSYDSPKELQKANPQGGADWSLSTGQDVILDHSFPEIDFISIHAWPDNWKETSPDFMQGWITAHETVARDLGKPLLMEEFGKVADDGNIGSVRDPIFSTVYTNVERAIEEDSPLRGSLFWELDPRNGGGRRPYSVFFKDSTFDLIRPHVAALEGLSTCAPVAPGAVPAAEATGPGAEALGLIPEPTPAAGK